MMEWYEALALLLGTIIVLMALGMPVALAFLAANIFGAWIFMGGERGVIQLLNNGLGALTSFALVPIPLFLLMGEVFFHTGLGRRMFNAIDGLLGRLPGRLSYVTVLGGTGFATLSGSSMGATALLGSLLVPEMNRRGYKNNMSIGPILGTGGLAIIIPPSALAVLLATLAKIDIGALLIAGIIPGLLLASLYLATIWIQTKIDPSAAPPYEVTPLTGREKLVLIARDILPMVGVMIVIVAMMMGGIATPSEGGRLRRARRDDPRGDLPQPDLAGPEALPRRRPQGHVNGLSDRLRLGDVQPADGVFRRLARADQLGDGFRSRAGLHAFGDVRGAAVAGHVHGADLYDAAHGADLLPAGAEPRLRSDLVRADHAACAGDQLHNAAFRAAALRDEGRRSRRHDHARHLSRGDPLHLLLADFGRPLDPLPVDRAVAAERVLAGGRAAGIARSDRRKCAFSFDAARISIAQSVDHGR